MDFNAFDTQKIREYAERAKKEWGATTEHQEFEAKNAQRMQKESGRLRILQPAWPLDDETLMPSMQTGSDFWQENRASQVRYLFRRGKPWYTECSESKVIKREVLL